MLARTMSAIAYRYLCLGILTVALLVSCGESEDLTPHDPGPGPGPGPGESVVDRNVTEVWGRVQNLEGAPLPDVHVEIGGSSTTTGSLGDFKLPASPGAAVVRFEKEGFLPTFRRVRVLDGAATAVSARMRMRAEPIVLDLDHDPGAYGARGAALELSPGALVDAAGNPVTGQVLVYLTPFDPSVQEEFDAMPGDFTATTSGGEPAILESFGVLEVTVTQNDQQLQVAPGATVNISIPAPAGVESPPDAMPFWSFDEQQGLWVEEGTGLYDAANGVYVSDIEHFSYWNADIVIESTCLSGRALDAFGAPLPGAHVVAGGVDYLGSASTTADENGEFCVVVRKDSTVRLTLSDGLRGLLQVEVESDDRDTTIPPDCADCLSVGDLTVSARGCEEVGNPWAHTCADGLQEIFECHQAEGDCTVRYGASYDDLIIEYASGAETRIFLDVFGDGGYDMNGEMYGPDGQLCGTMYMEGSEETSEEGMRYEIGAPDGRTWLFEQDIDTGDITVSCPNGESFVMTGAQIEAWQACAGQEDQECTFEGDMGTPDFGMCSTDDDCRDAEFPDAVCCDYMGSQICLDRATCEQMQSMGCTNDEECGDGEVCCDLYGTPMCLPEMAC